MSLLSIGFSGLNASQIALNISAQNIANVNTIGYSRQEAMMGSLSGFGRMDNGMGVEVTGVRRITDDYLVSQHWRSRSATGSSYAFHQYINTTEQLLGSESMNITKGLDSFFASLSAALDSPETPAQRSQIVSSAGVLVNRFGQLNESLLTQEKQIDDQLGSTITQVNSYLKQVAELNTQIGEQASKGVNTSALEDSREQIVRELSTFMEVRVNRQSDGSFSLSLPQGQPLVLAGSSSTLSLAGDTLSLSFGPQSFEVPRLQGGTLAGVLEYRTTVLRPLRDELNQIAKKLADDFNAKQAGGVDLNGDPGKPLFSYDPLNPSGTLKVADGFTGNLIFKTYEGVAKVLMNEMKGLFKKNAFTLLSALGVSGGLTNLKAKFDYKEYGGAVMLGVQKPVVKAHGSADARTFKNAIKQAVWFLQNDLIGHIETALAAPAASAE